MVASVAKKPWTVKVNESGLYSAARIKGPEDSKQLTAGSRQNSEVRDRMSEVRGKPDL